MKERDHRLDKILRLLVLAEDVLSQAQVDQTLLLLKLVTDHGERLWQHLAIDQLKILKLQVFLTKENDVSLSSFTKRNVLKDKAYKRLSLKQVDGKLVDHIDFIGDLTALLDSHDFLRVFFDFVLIHHVLVLARMSASRL